MNKFQVLVLEHRQHWLTIEAPDADAALKTASEMVDNDADFGAGEVAFREAVDALPMVKVECDSEADWTGTLDAWAARNGEDAALTREVCAAIERGEAFDRRDETHGVYLRVTPL